jgi:hypothetical protein
VPANDANEANATYGERARFTLMTTVAVLVRTANRRIGVRIHERENIIFERLYMALGKCLQNGEATARIAPH